MIYFAAFDITNLTLDIIGYMVDISFMLDILVNFNLAYKTEEVYETNKKNIAL